MTAMTPGSNIPLPTARVTVDVAAPVRLDVSGLLLTADGKVRSDDDFIFYNQPTGPGVTYRSGGGTAPTPSRSTPRPYPRHREDRRDREPRRGGPDLPGHRAHRDRPRRGHRRRPGDLHTPAARLGDGPGGRRDLPAQRRLEGPRGRPGLRRRAGRYRQGLRRLGRGAGRPGPAGDPAGPQAAPPAPPAAAPQAPPAPAAPRPRPPPRPAPARSTWTRAGSASRRTRRSP